VKPGRHVRLCALAPLGRSDYQAFIVNHIPSGGLFTGAEVPKTDEQQAIWCGVADEQFDPCYHAACDTFANVNRKALTANADAVAFSILTLRVLDRDGERRARPQRAGTVHHPRR
jgi:Zn-dependent M28 family amino/carboxypeptidase